MNNIRIAQVAKLLGKNSYWIRACIISGYLPIGIATRNGEKKYNLSILNSSKYLLPMPDGSRMTYDKYRHNFESIVIRLRLNSDHRCHDCRKHFITMAKYFEVDEYVIKYIVGHAINDITEKTYATRSLEWLNKEINKIN